MKITLKTNGKVNAIGVNPNVVKLSVEVEGISMTSVNCQIFKNKSDMERGNAIYSAMSSCNTQYASSCCECNTEYYWRATIFCADGKVYAESTKFETGMIGSDFSAEWICDPTFDGYVSEFKKSFNVDKKVKKARLHIVGLGFYHSFINGNPTDDYYYKPVLTDFSIRENLNNKHYNEDNFRTCTKTVCYDTFDVTDLIKQGENTLSVLLGTGWFCNTDKDITDPSYNYGTPRLIFELHIETQNGVQKVLSDTDCLVRATAIRSQMFEGDRIDFTAEDKPFINAEKEQAPTGKLIPNEGVLDKVFEQLDPISVSENNGVLEYDFGKNHTGSVRAIVKGKRGSKIRFQFYEVKKNGELNPNTSRWLAYQDGLYVIGHLDQVNEYVLSGDEDLVIPYFHWNSYRYVTICCDEPFEIKEIKSLFITADMKQNGFFECDNQFFNTLHEAFVLTQRDNMHCSVPSDCPQREKLPYTGDGQLVCETANYVFDAESFYRKWNRDIMTAQGKNGYVPYTAPFIAGGGGLWWSNAVVVVPFVLYNMTGDDRIIKDASFSALSLVDYYCSKHNGDYINTGSDSSWCLGDWLTPEVTVLDKAYMNTLAWYYAVDKTIEMCRIAHRSEELPRLEELKENVANAINQKFYNPETGNYADGIQGANILPILFGIAKGEIREKALNNLIEHYEKTEHFDTGIVLTPRLLDLLVEVGRSDLAYKLLDQKTAPSYYTMLQGETTLPEHWNKHWPGAPDSDVSHNHPMFGSVIAWLYKHVAGLDLTNLKSKEITFAPKLIKEVGSANASKKTVYGKVKVEYSTKNGFTMKISLPTALSGKVLLPEYLTDVKVNGKFYDNEFNVYGGDYVITASI